MAENDMTSKEGARTPGALRAEPGRYVYELAKIDPILGGPAYSTAEGVCVEGDRMMIALMRMAKGTGAVAHSHPNEQWIYIMQGVFHATVGGVKHSVPAGSVIYIPSNTIHEGRAGEDQDVLFFTCKDTSHSLHGIKAA